jgi:hypothetical protein
MAGVQGSSVSTQGIMFMSTDKYYAMRATFAPNVVVHDDLHILWTIFM